MGSDDKNASGVHSSEATIFLFGKKKCGKGMIAADRSQIMLAIASLPGGTSGVVDGMIEAKIVSLVGCISPNRTV